MHGNITAHLSPDHGAPQLELATELIEVATQAGDPERVLDAHPERCEALLELGDIEAARAELEAMAARGAELRQPSQDWFVGATRRAWRCSRAVRRGGGSDDAARALGERAQSWNATVTYRLQLYALRREQGRLAEIEELVRRSVAGLPDLPDFRCVAGAHLRRARAHDEARDGSRRSPRTLRRASLRRGMAREHLPARGVGASWARQARPWLYERLAPYDDRVAISYPELSIGVVALAWARWRPRSARRRRRAALRGRTRAERPDRRPPMARPHQARGGATARSWLVAQAVASSASRASTALSRVGLIVKIDPGR